MVLHTKGLKESEMIAWNFCTLKIKYNLMLCQSRLHTASETFFRSKKIGTRFDFLCFRIRSILIRKDDEYENTQKRVWNFRTHCARTLRKTCFFKNLSIKV